MKLSRVLLPTAIVLLLAFIPAEAQETCICDVVQCETLPETAPSSPPIPAGPSLFFGENTVVVGVAVHDGKRWSNNLAPGFRRALVVRHLSGRDLGSPVHDGVFVHPLAVGDASGRLHVVWAEPDSAQWTEPVPGAFLPKTTSLWYAFHDGETWSAVQRILAEADIEWSSNGPARPLILADGNIHIAAAVKTSEGEHGIAHVVGHGTQWRSEKIMLHLPARYLSLTQMRSGEVRLTYSGAPPITEPFELDGVYSLVMTAGGKGEPRMLRLPIAEAYEISLLEGIDGTQHLLWVSQLEPIERDKGVRYARSDDGGQSWSEARTVYSAARWVVELRAFITADGAVHAVFSKLTHPFPSSFVVSGTPADQLNRTYSLTCERQSAGAAAVLTPEGLRIVWVTTQPGTSTDWRYSTAVLRE